MTDDYTPLTDEQVGAIRDDLQWRVPDVLRRILADREHYKRRAETAEQRCSRCGHGAPFHMDGADCWFFVGKPESAHCECGGFTQ